MKKEVRREVAKESEVRKHEAAGMASAIDVNVEDFTDKDNLRNQPR